jgi:excisionase family DNA binding protein
MDEKLLTPQDVADRLGVKVSTVYYWSHIGYIPTVKLGRLIRFRWSKVNHWLEKKEREGRARRTISLDEESGV